MSEFLKRFTSRKFLLALLAAVLVFGNSYWDWGLSNAEIVQVLTPILAFLGVEGLLDLMKDDR